jgi:hypothetical protein
MKNNRDIEKTLHPLNKKYVETIKCRLKTSLLEWWKLISEKRCDDYAH